MVFNGARAFSEDLEEFFVSLDTDDSGTISFEEFANGLLELRMKRNAYAQEEADAENQAVIDVAYLDPWHFSRVLYMILYVTIAIEAVRGLFWIHEMVFLPFQCQYYMCFPEKSKPKRSVKRVLRLSKSALLVYEDALDAFSAADLGITGFRRGQKVAHSLQASWISRDFTGRYKIQRLWSPLAPSISLSMA